MTNLDIIDKGCIDLPIDQIKYGDCGNVADIKELHIDGDIIAYYAATLPSVDGSAIIEKIDDLVLSFTRVLPEGVSIKMHLTGETSNKGGRKFYSRFTTQGYQANRGTPSSKPPLLSFAKTYIKGLFDTIVWEDREADDGVAHFMAKNPKTTCCLSRDKDFRMNRGWHLDWETLVFVYVDSYHVLYDGKHYGDAQLIYQLLAGDAADNVQGIKTYGHKKSTHFIQQFDNFKDAFIECLQIYNDHKKNIWANLCLLLMRQSNDGKMSTSFAEFINVVCKEDILNIGFEPYECWIKPFVILEEMYAKAQYEERKSLQRIITTGTEQSVSDLWTYH